MAMRDTSYRADAILQDGSSLNLRSLRADDKPLLHLFFRRLSQRAAYLKFFRAKQGISEGDLAQFIELDFRNDFALVAVLKEKGIEKIIGVGKYNVIRAGSETPRRAEMVVTVGDEHQGRGIGTLLLEHLVQIGRSHGVTEFHVDVPGENDGLLRVFADSGFHVTHSAEGGSTHLTFPTEQTEAAEEAHLRRERHAAAQSIRAILNPRSVAIIGASRQPGTIGAALVANIKGCGFTGPIYPVNPKASEIDSLKSYPTVSAIDAQVDLALIAVPAAAVEQSIRDCAAAGVRGVVVISSGFGELSPEGRRIELQLRELARHSGMRMVGPNCMGLLNTDPRVSLNATFVPSWPPAGNIGMLSQSGALGYVILDHIQSLNIGLSSFVSVGNKADVSGNDLISYWAEDPATKVIVLYLESFGNPRKFARLTPEVSRSKPIVAVKAGRSAAGTRAASSHSAALASLDVAVDALFEQAGVIRTETLEELMDVAILLSSQPIPAGPRVGLITNGGGAGILLADACEARGLSVPEFSAETVQKLREHLPSQAGLANPIDLIASANAEQYSAAMRLAGADPNIDSLIVIYIPPQLHPPEEVAKAIATAAGEIPPEKPVLTVFMSTRGNPLLLSKGPRGRLPSYSFPENAARALSAAERYGRWRKRPRGSVLILDAFARSAIRGVVERVLRDAESAVWLEPADMSAILRAAGIEVAATEEVHPQEALKAAERMGYPLVLKAKSEKLLHKSDVGGVFLGLRSREDVALAMGNLTLNMKKAGIVLDKILLQQEVRGGLEALVGVTTDPTFGPLLVCGLGGVLVEMLKDVSFRLTPVSDLDAEEMISRLHTGRLLDGYRGAAAGDRRALIDIIRRVSALVELVPELRELDLNPVKVLEPGRGAVAVDCRMRIGRPQ